MDFNLSNKIGLTSCIAITSSGKKPEIDIGDKARTLKEKFETGEVFKQGKEGSGEHRLQDDEMEVFEQGIKAKETNQKSFS